DGQHIEHQEEEQEGRDEEVPAQLIRPIVPGDAAGSRRTGDRHVRPAERGIRSARAPATTAPPGPRPERRSRPCEDQPSSRSFCQRSFSCCIAASGVFWPTQTVWSVLARKLPPEYTVNSGAATTGISPTVANSIPSMKAPRTDQGWPPVL